MSLAQLYKSKMMMTFKTLNMLGPLPIRIPAGILFIAHGLPKFEDIGGTQGFLAA